MLYIIVHGEDQPYFMKDSGALPIVIINVRISKEYVYAHIYLADRGVFMVSVSCGSGNLLHKRFIQLETGDNSLQMPVGFLQRGQYVLSLLKGNQVARKIFNY